MPAKAKASDQTAKILGITTSVVVLIGTIVSVLLWLNGHFNAIDRRLQANESAIKAIASQSNENTKDLVKDLLQVALTSPVRTPALVTAAAVSTKSILSTRTQYKNPAPPAFFTQTASALSELATTGPPQVQQPVLAAYAQLATYRSALNQTGAFAKPLGITVELQTGSNLRISADDHWQGGLIWADSPTATFALAEGLPRVLSGQTSVVGLDMYGGTVDLAGISWSNVTFYGTRIKYSAGELALQNVRFVGCTFETPVNSSQQVLEYAALDSRSLAIRG